MFHKLAKATVGAVFCLCLGLISASAQAPTIVSLSPANGEVRVPVNTSIVIQFSTSMDRDVYTTFLFVKKAVKAPEKGVWISIG